MSEAYNRVLAPGDLELRGDGRTLFGLVVPFDTEARVSDGGRPYREVFRRGAFTRTIQHRGDRVKLLINHDRQRLPIGKATHLEERSHGLYGEFRVSNTSEGDQALELVRDGVLDAFSVGFKPIQHKGNPATVVERTEVGLNEASVVAFPAYDEALIGGVRMDIFNHVTFPEGVDPYEAVTEALARYLSTLEEEPAASTSSDGPATETPGDPASATRRISPHHSVLMARKIREALS